MDRREKELAALLSFCSISVMNTTENPALIAIPVLVGPTASGKTALSEQIHAQYPEVEIISADSRQIYVGMDIGTAKPPQAFLQRVPHHLVDIIHPDVRYSAGKFARDASAAINAILERGKIPLIAGGTGFYIRALFEGLQAPAADPVMYSQLEKRVEVEGYDALLEELYRLDPNAAKVLPPENRAKTLRALACCLQTGVPYSQFLLEQKEILPVYKPVPFCLMPDRNLLYERINLRVVDMVNAGLLEETQKLLAQGYTTESPGMKTVGYKEALQYLSGDFSHEEMITAIQQSTRRYAKRQVTWFRGQLPETTTYAETTEGWGEWFSRAAQIKKV